MDSLTIIESRMEVECLCGGASQPLDKTPKTRETSLSQAKCVKYGYSSLTDNILILICKKYAERLL